MFLERLLLWTGGFVGDLFSRSPHASSPHPALHDGGAVYPFYHPAALPESIQNSRGCLCHVPVRGFIVAVRDRIFPSRPLHPGHGLKRLSVGLHRHFNDSSLCPSTP